MPEAVGSSRRLLLVPLGVGLALVGAAVVESARRGTEGGSPPALSWVLFGLAAACAVFAVRDPPLLPLTPSTPLAGLWARRPATLALGAALLFAALSIPLFVHLNAAAAGRAPGWLSNDASWLLWALSLIAFAAAVALWQRSAPRPSAPPGPGWPRVLPRRIELPLLAGLTAVALALRLPDLGSIPHGLWFDEAQNGLVARQLTSGGATHSVFLGDLTQMGALYFYALGGLLSLLGDEVWVLRLLPALAGAATVPLLYGLASRLYGWRVGVAAAGLLAVSSWNITFSRFGMASMAAVALDLVVYLCVVQGLRTGRVAWYAAGGTALGLDLHGYYIARLVPFVLLLLVAHICLRARTEVRSLRAGAAAFAAGAVLAVLPVAVFAIQKPNVYEARISTVSIFSKTGGAGDPHAVQKSLRAHLLMFNYRGDTNGRHNIPGSPMLDWLTAALFLSGLGVCLLRLWRWQYFFPFVWFGAALSGGVLSLLVEAPQAHRTLENSAVTALLAGIFLGGAWEALHGRAGRRRLAAPAVAAAALVAVGGASAMNVEKYFWRQAEDGRVWSDMGVSQLDAALLLRRHPGDEAWLTDVYANQPDRSFLAPQVHPNVWFGAYQLPFTERDRDVLLLLDPDRGVEVPAIAADYPGARFVRYQKGGAILLYAVTVPRSLLASSHGALVYRRGRPHRVAGTRIGPGAADRLVATVAVSSYGTYRFAWPSAGGEPAEISVDERPLGPGATRALAAGVHRLEIRGFRGPGGPLLWAPAGRPLRPVPAASVFDPRRIRPSGLTGLYRQGLGFDGPVTLERVDPVLSIYFQTLPVARPFTVEWRGELRAPKAGPYFFELRAADTARLFIDGRAVLTREVPGVPQSVIVPLEKGWHRIHVLYRAYTGFFNISLLWSPPGRPLSVVPSTFLRPFKLTRPPFGPAPGLDESDGMLPPGRLVTIDG